MPHSGGSHPTGAMGRRGFLQLPVRSFGKIVELGKQLHEFNDLKIISNDGAFLALSITFVGRAASDSSFGRPALLNIPPTT
jgi:hypothetical protein